jgi:hypothetical protein
MNDKQRPENMDDIFSREQLEFMCQYKIRSQVMRVLKENFDVKEILVIQEKKQ